MIVMMTIIMMDGSDCQDDNKVEKNDAEMGEFV